MQLDSIRTLKCAPAGTTTSKFTDVMEAVFGIDETEMPELEEEEPDEGETPEFTTITEGEAVADDQPSTSGSK